MTLTWCPICHSCIRRTDDIVGDMESLTHLALVWGAVYVAFILARKTRLTPVLWYLAMGSILVNAGLLPVEPDPFIRGLGGENHRNQ